MTLPYGGTSYGLGQQQIDDARKHGIDLLTHMEHKWGAFLGREVYENCRKSLKRPMQLLSVFESAGKKAEEAGKFLSWDMPPLSINSTGCVELWELVKRCIYLLLCH
jgi:hypothetical protein